MKAKHHSLLLTVLMTVLITTMVSCGKSSTYQKEIDDITGQTEFITAEFSPFSTDEITYAEDDVKPTAESPAVSAAVREIEEADIVKIYGSQLYILNRYKGMIICDISQPDLPSVMGRTALSGEPVEMYVKNNTAYILTKSPVYMPYYSVIDTAVALYPGETGVAVSTLYEVDISDSITPVVSKQTDIEGTITESRIVGSILYVVSTFGRYTGDGYSADSYVTSFNIEASGSLTEIDRATFNSGTSYIHVTDTAIFSVVNRRSYPAQSAEITYVDISDTGGEIVIRGTVSVRGLVDDKFKLNAYDGYLRICAYDGNSQESLLHVVSLENPDHMTVTGELVVVKDERLYATRFNGSTAYIVTFEVVDPLWVVDLSDPRNPEILGELEVPGWSTHIDVRNNRLIALGVDNSASSSQVAVSYFNVENPADPLLIKRLSFGEETGWSYSPGYYDDKAFNIIDSLGLILLPYSTSFLSGDRYIHENRLQLIGFSEDDIRAGGWITQNGEVLRSGSYEDRLFSVSNDELRVIDASVMDVPSVTAVLPLAQNVRKVLTLKDGFGVIAIDKYDGTTVLQSVELSNTDIPVSGELHVKGAVSDIFSDTGSRVYVVSNNTYPVYSEGISGTSIITVYDFSSVTDPVQKGSLEIKGNYYTFFDEKRASSIQSNQSRVFYLGDDDYLFESNGMIYYYPYDIMEADALYRPVYDNERTIIIADFTDSDTPVKSSDVTLDKGIDGGFIRNRTYYYSYATDYVSPLGGDNLKKYFLGRIDVADPKNPVVLKNVNIPGIALNADASGSIFYTVSAMLDSDDEKVFTFNSIELKDDLATGISQVPLNAFPGNYIVTGSRAYFEPFRYWYYGMNDAKTVVVDIDPNGGLTAFTSKRLSEESHKTLLWADGNNLISGSGIMLSLYDATSPSELKPYTDLPIRSWFKTITRSGEAAYIALGYEGVGTLTLLSD